jgi:hypothetical protein
MIDELGIEFFSFTMEGFGKAELILFLKGDLSKSFVFV